MVSDKKSCLANAVGGKTARACDSCLRKRARYYCAADDAFLCQGCDASVHSANALASRHERLRLKEASFKHLADVPVLENSLRPWHYGFTRKARTPRHGKPANTRNPLRQVPDVAGDDDEDTFREENEEDQLLYTVPVFDPFAADQLCTTGNSNDNKPVTSNNSNDEVNQDGFPPLPLEMDLAEFAADVESLLGKALDEESFDMEGLGILDCNKEKNSNLAAGSLVSSGKVKVEDDDKENNLIIINNQIMDSVSEINTTKEIFELNFDYNFPVQFDEINDLTMTKTSVNHDEESKAGDVKVRNRKILLSLDYDCVMMAWADHKSPWTTGERPELDPSDCWPNGVSVCGQINHHSYGVEKIMGNQATIGDGGREARVLRYREKRRTRLFSKKIRYEVRKLNAEKRPRMKGRFVKRANISAPTFSFT